MVHYTALADCVLLVHDDSLNVQVFLQVTLRYNINRPLSYDDCFMLLLVHPSFCGIQMQ